MISSKISNRVLVVGPTLDGKGGISTVVNTYKQMMEVFKYVCTLKSPNALGKLCDVLVAIICFIRALMFGSCELVHIHTASYIDFYRNAIFVILAKLFRKKVLLHIHGAEFEQFYARHKSFVAYVCGKADALVVVSTYFMNFIKENQLSSNVYLLHNIIERPVIVGKDSFENIFNVSFVGSVCERKGIYDVVVALGKCKNIFQGRMILHIAGNGDIEYLKSLINNYGLSDIVKYWGWADAQLKQKILSFSDAFIHPSYFESFGISILEAMSYKLPVITTAVGGIPDFVENGVNGIFVDSGNEKQICEALSFLIDHSDECHRMGENAEYKAQCFYSDIIEPKIVEMYEELLNK